MVVKFMGVMIETISCWQTDRQSRARQTLSVWDCDCLWSPLLIL